MPRSLGADAQTGRPAGRPGAARGDAAKSRPGVLFDIDGTLVDNTYLHTIAWWRACRDCGQSIDSARLHRLVGMGSDHLIDTLFHREWDELRAAHSRHYSRLKPELRAFPGARDLLRAVDRGGADVVLASSASEGDLADLRAAIGADDAIAAVTTADDVGSTKPAPDIVGVALERAGVAAGNAVMVGDTGWDVEAAARARVPCIGVLTGGWSQGELESAGAIAVYANVGDLLAHLDTSPIGAVLERRAAT